MRMAPVPTWKGRKSFALAEFDPFWEAVQEADILVGMHSTDQGYQRYLNDWEGTHSREMLPFGRGTSPGFPAMSSYKSAVIDGCASIIGHGLATRFPRLRFAPTEFVEDWVRPFVTRAAEAYDRSPVLFDEDPVAVFRRNIFAHIFREPNPKEVADLVGGVDNILWGSDFPHPEGLGRPARILRARRVAVLAGGHGEDHGWQSGPDHEHRRLTFCCARWPRGPHRGLGTKTISRRKNRPGRARKRAEKRKQRRETAGGNVKQVPPADQASPNARSGPADQASPNGRSGPSDQAGPIRRLRP